MAITGEQIYNLTRAALASDPSTAAYAGMLPDPTASNIGEVGAIYNSDTMLQNAFLGAIVNKVASTIIETKSFQNPLVYRDWETDRKSTRLNSSHSAKSRMPSSA